MHDELEHAPATGAERETADERMTDSTDNTGPGDPPFQPSEEWIDAFTKQCTEALRLDLRTYAKRRARGVGRTGAHVDESYVEDLVADALADTLFGVVAWEPTAKTLYQHAEDTIRYRTRHARKRARRYPHERLDAPASAADQQVTRGLVEASLRHDQDGETAEGVIFANEVLAQLRELAAGDAGVLRYLDTLVAGAHTKTEIMEATKMSTKTFRNTRDRLGRLIEQLDQRVAASARGVRA
jgi:hypothetical protein